MECVIVCEKVTTWFKHVITVEADSQQEALNKVIECYKEGSDIFNEDDIGIINSENLSETEEAMTVEENGNSATVEILNSKGQVVWNNAEVY